MSASLPDTTLTLNTTSSVPIGDYPIEYIDWIVLVNASPFASRGQVGGYQVLIPAWYQFPIPLRDAAGNPLPGIGTPVQITPYLQTIPATKFTSVLHTMIYMRGEQPPQVAPAPLGGGPQDLTVASSIVNTGNPQGTQVVYAQTASDAGTNATSLQIFNDGKIALGDVNNPAPKVELFGNAGGAVHMGTDYIGGPVPIIMNNNKPIQWNDNLNAPHDIFKVDASNNLSIFATPGGNMALKDSASNAQIILDTTGVTFLSSLLVNGSTASLNGGTSGTATAWCPIKGTAGILTVIQLSNFKTGGANQILTLPTAYANRALVLTTDCESTQLNQSGTQQGVRQWTAFGAAGAAGTTTAATTWQGFNLLWLASAFNQIQFNASWASAHNGVIVIVGS